MAIQLGSAYGKVEIDASGVQRGVKTATSSLQMLQQVGEKVGAGLSNIGNRLTVGVTLPLVAAGAASIKYASDLNETMSKVNVIFGDMTKEVIKWSDTSAQALGQSKQQALDAASNFAIFGKAANLADQDLVDFAESNVQLASDLASFFNTSPEEAITAIGAAYRGESEPIRKYGVLINEAALQQKALELGLIDSLGPLTQQQKILAANALILDQTKDAQGDFSRTSDGLANSSRILNAQFKDTLATLGQNLLPMALAVTKALNGMLEAFNKLPPGVQKGILILLGLLAVAGPLLSFFGTIISAVTTISAALPTISALLSGVGAVITGTLIPAIGALLVELLPIILIIAAIALAIYVLYLAWKNNFLGIQDIVKNFIAKVKAIWDILMKIRDGLVLLYEDGSGALLDLAEAFGFPSEAAQEFLSNIWLAMNKLRDIFARAREFIVNAFTKTDWGQIGKYIMYGIANGLLLGIPGLIMAATNAVKAVLDTFDKGLDAHSPSRKMMQRGKWSGQGYMLGLHQSMNPDEISRSLVRPITQNSSQQQNITMQIANGVTIQQVRGMIDASMDALSNTLINNLGGA